MSILVIWSIITNGNGYYSVYDWRPIGTFESQVACQNAAAQLGYKNNDRYRCLGGAK